MKKRQLVLDIECYKNYFLAMLMTADGRVKRFEIRDDQGSLDDLKRYIEHPDVEVLTFNGNNYDIPMIALALSGSTNLSLRKASDKIINENLKPWQFYKHYNLDELVLDHIDLIEVAPGQVGLKIYGGRLHSPKMQDLPIELDATIDENMAEQLALYCRNDLDVTWRLARQLTEQIDLRRTMSEQYGVDLRSKSDAQIAEVVLKSEITKITQIVPVREKRLSYSSFKYEPPGHVKFFTEDFKNALDVIRTADMVVKDTGHVEMPEAIEKLDLSIGGNKYKVGIGGLHSQESEVAHFSDEEYVLIDRDVASYYPNLMLNMGMYPPALGENFLSVYRNILNTRLAAKHSGDKVTNEVLKIVLNGTFGKTSNQYSILYNPKMMIQTTLTGQLSLLMLIEALERRSISVVSANTDGIVIKCPRARYDEVTALIHKWEKITNLETEETRYKALYSRDVNNYVALKEKGGVKTKGVYASSGLHKNPCNEVCVEAVTKYLTENIPCERTIMECEDVTKFLTLRTVKGGAVKQGYTLGKAIRWYYAIGVDGVITYKENGNTVPRTEGAKPLMDLPEKLPKDIDHSWYILECVSMLRDIAAIPRPPKKKLPRRNTKEWAARLEAGELVEVRGEWMWADEDIQTEMSVCP
jgi:DNA polymerase elongation subunit (family B)